MDDIDVRIAEIRRQYTEEVRFSKAYPGSLIATLGFALEVLSYKDASIARLKSQLAETERTLAAAIKDMHTMANVFNICFPCNHFTDLKSCALPGDDCRFEWRGVCDANRPA